jgi:hypothetical protein
MANVNEVTKGDVKKFLAHVRKVQPSPEELNSPTYYARTFLEEDLDTSSSILAVVKPKEVHSSMPNVCAHLTLSDCSRSITWHFDTYIRDPAKTASSKAQYFERQQRNFAEIANMQAKSDKIRTIVNEFLDHVDNDLYALKSELESTVEGHVGKVMEKVKVEDIYDSEDTFF